MPVGAPGVDYRTFNSGILKTRFQGPDLGFRLFFYSGILKGPVLNIYYYIVKQDAFFPSGRRPGPGWASPAPPEGFFEGMGGCKILPATPGRL